ncbi:D-alanine--D-alanine ligase [secondary endosymbiont of Heteropsylla cubana]|uniref:D-alanine--D-alanine ligase n=1 Tax=secondary endosymbiont of Heteropsylla cubana TaxID=134287 RepID=J3VUE8_9ENTR|nr:D-alanine--D-alanine ligase [secondary endosymbiont of Heteropsylla cubana]AFP85766.1 D-alanine--D-alanine ligase [secondary endosymbiont of Heteropsylla cubana]
MKQRNKEKQRIAVLFGGDSTEHQVSLRSSIDVVRSINRKKYDLTLIGVNKDGCWTLCNENQHVLNVDNLNTICLGPSRCCLAVVPGKSGIQLINSANGFLFPSVDVVFSLLHGACGENGSMQGLLRVMNIPHVGPDVLASAICIDKDMTKRVLRDAGILVTPSITLLRNADSISLDIDSIIDQLGLPLFIKPARQGSSIGITKVNYSTDFKLALELAFSYDSKVIVEQEICGREISIALLGNDFPEVSVCGEIFPNSEFYDYDAKYLNDSQATLVAPAKLSMDISHDLIEIARKAYLVLECNVMARIDFFLSNRGTILLNEVNTLPGFTSLSIYPKLWEASGLDYPDLLDRLITLAIDRR